MREVVEALRARVEQKKAIHPINKGTAYLEIGEIRIVDEQNYAIALLRISDTTAPDAYYSNPNTGASRVVRKRKGEGRGFGAHLLISLVEEDGRPNNYLALLEKNQGLHRSHALRLFQAVLRGQYKESEGEEAFECADPSGARDREGRVKMIKFRPMLTFSGHPSEDLLRELEAGILKDITLVHSYEKKTLGSRPWLERKDDLLRFRATSGKPLKDAWSELKAFFGENAKKGYEKARVKFVKPDKTSEFVEFDTTTGNIIDERYVKTRLISDINPLMDDCSDAILDHFMARLEGELIEHRGAGAPRNAKAKPKQSVT